MTSSAPGEALDRAVLLLPGEHAIDVEPVHVADAGDRVGHGDDRRALVGHQLGGDRAGVAEALDRDRRPRAGPCRGGCAASTTV